jgi:hypothetical protein
MTDELLGELAARMKLIADALPQHKLSALQALGLARECLRQMEWARKRCATRMEDFGHHDYSPVEPPLTIAPENYNRAIDDAKDWARWYEKTFFKPWQPTTAELKRRGLPEDWKP